MILYCRKAMQEKTRFFLFILRVITNITTATTKSPEFSTKMRNDVQHLGAPGLAKKKNVGDWQPLQTERTSKQRKSYVDITTKANDDYSCFYYISQGFSRVIMKKGFGGATTFLYDKLCSGAYLDTIVTKLVFVSLVRLRSTKVTVCQTKLN